MNNTCKSYTPSRSWSQRSRAPYNFYTTYPHTACEHHFIHLLRVQPIRRPYHHPVLAIDHLQCVYKGLGRWPFSTTDMVARAEDTNFTQLELTLQIALGPEFSAHVVNILQSRLLISECCCVCFFGMYSLLFFFSFYFWDEPTYVWYLLLISFSSFDE